MDYRTNCHDPELCAIIYDLKSNTGGVCVCHKHGVITHDGITSEYWVLNDKYSVKTNEFDKMPIPPKLQAEQDLEFGGKYDPKYQYCISSGKYVDQELGSMSPVRLGGVDVRRGVPSFADTRRKE